MGKAFTAFAPGNVDVASICTDSSAMSMNSSALGLTS
jgi:hypothetical protein